MAKVTNMNENFEELLTELDKKLDESCLIELLTSIRAQVQWPKFKVQIVKLQERRNMLKILKLLKTQQKNVIDACLSILINCVMEVEYRETYIRKTSIPDYLKVMSSLDELMKRYPEETNINGKIMNIIGNMCICKTNFTHTIIDNYTHIVKRVLDFLEIASSKDNYSEVCLNMALRLLRILGNSVTHPICLKKLNVFEVVWRLFTKTTAEWKKTGKKDKLLRKIIRVLDYYSGKENCSTNTIENNSLKCLTEVAVLSPMNIGNIIGNFWVDTKEFHLMVCETFDVLYNMMLNTDLQVQELDDIHLICVDCLCFLLDRLIIVDIERSRACVKVLFKLLQSCEDTFMRDVKCWVSILKAFVKLEDADFFLNELIDCNIINVLMYAMNCVLGDCDERKLTDMHEIHHYVRTREEGKEMQFVSKDDACDFSCRKYPSCHSSFQCDMVLTFSSDNDNDINLRDDDVARIFKSLRRTTVEPSNVDDSHGSMDQIELFIIETCKLIAIFRRIQPNNSQLGSKELIKKLIQGAMYFTYKNVCQTQVIGFIIEILKSPTVLSHLIQTDILQDLFDLSLYESRKLKDVLRYKNQTFENWSEKLLQCFSHVADSMPANGNFERALTEGDETMRAQMVIVMPYIIKDGGILHQLLVACGGLKIMFEFIERDGQYRQACISSLCFLVRRRLNISRSKFYFERLVMGEDKRKSEMVTFKLDDGSLVEADLNLLRNKSDYFSAMFSGHFRENVRDEIELHGVDFDTFQCVLDSLERIDFEKYDIQLLLNAVEFSDRCLLTDLCRCLISWIKTIKTTRFTAPAIYKWSLETGLDMFRVHLVRFILTFESDHESRSYVENLYSLGCNSELSGDIQELIGESLPKLEQGLLIPEAPMRESVFVDLTLALGIEKWPTW